MRPGRHKTLTSPEDEAPEKYPVYEAEPPPLSKDGSTLKDVQTHSSHGLKNRNLALLILAILIPASALGGMLWYFRNANTSSLVVAPTHLAGSLVITSANLSSSSGALLVAVKNTGSLNLVGLGQPSVSAGGNCSSWGWNPSPASTYPVYPGEGTKGDCILTSQYRSGLQVTVSFNATFSDGSTEAVSIAITVA